MKQNMVVRVYMDLKQVSLLRKLFDIEGKKISEERMRTKILKTVVSVAGVDKAEFKRSDKSLVEVESLLRSSGAVIESIRPVKEDARKEGGIWFRKLHSSDS